MSRTVPGSQQSPDRYWLNGCLRNRTYHFDLIMTAVRTAGLCWFEIVLFAWYGRGLQSHVARIEAGHSIECLSNERKLLLFWKNNSRSEGLEWPELHLWLLWSWIRDAEQTQQCMLTLAKSIDESCHWTLCRPLRKSKKSPSGVHLGIFSTMRGTHIVAVMLSIQEVEKRACILPFSLNRQLFSTD